MKRESEGQKKQKNEQKRPTEQEIHTALKRGGFFVGVKK